MATLGHAVWEIKDPKDCKDNKDEARGLAAFSVSLESLRSLHSLLDFSAAPAPYPLNTTLCRASHPRKAGLPGAKGSASPAFWARTVKRSPLRSRTIHSVLAPW